MQIKKYEYNGYLIEINQHPIYNDYEFVIKTLDEKEVKGTSTIPYIYEDEAHLAAQLIINQF
jgi:hypothetical protein